MDNIDRHAIPVAPPHNRILSWTWIWSSFVLFAGYCGTKFRFVKRSLISNIDIN